MCTSTTLLRDKLTLMLSDTPDDRPAMHVAILANQAGRLSEHDLSDLLAYLFEVAPALPAGKQLFTTPRI